MDDAFEESGHDFEVRALGIARAIHDPLGVQGSVIHAGSQRDGLFLKPDEVHAYEFTVGHDRQKAVKDADKIGQILSDYRRMPEHRYKSFTGWFVTRDEPEAEQRDAVGKASQRHGMTIHAISVSTLQQRICDSEDYLRCRDNAPFGSLAYEDRDNREIINIPVTFDGIAERKSVEELAGHLTSGGHTLLTGEFGVGKSHAMREVYRALRKAHLKKRKLTPFPLLINLRDCVGLKTPAEILRRHAEDIGFANDRSLISAWRSGACVLLLDGFDEVVPVRWMGRAQDLKAVRWEALAPVRRLVEESPSGTGVLISGRSHYFSAQSEMREALGLTSGDEVLKLHDFDQDQLTAYLQASSVSSSIPEWLPARPLLLGYLVQRGVLEDLDAISALSRAGAWRNMLDEIARRESRMFTAVRPEVIKRIVARVATLARSGGSETGPVTMELLSEAFVHVNGRQPDEEGLQVLMRLPGLTETPGEDEARLFADKDLADTAYAEDLANYLATPYEDHPLNKVAAWVNAASSLGVEVATEALAERGQTGKAVLAAAERRQNGGLEDAVLLDSLRIASALSADGAGRLFSVSGIYVDQLILEADDTILPLTTFRECAIDELNVASVEGETRMPHFSGGIIGLIEGVPALTPWLRKHIDDSVEVTRFTSVAQTTAALLQLDLQAREKVGLAILRKVYDQRGSGRKESALRRGLDLTSRELVPGVVTSLLKDGWLQVGTAAKNTIYLPVKSRRAAALQALESPADFRLSK